MEIRPLLEMDAAAYRDLRIDALTTAPVAFHSTAAQERQKSVEEARGFLAERNSPRDYILGAMDQGEILGAVGFYQKESENQKHKGYIWFVYVRPEHQGRGLATRLLTEVVERARTHLSVEQITLSVADAQRPARNVYERLGFQIYGTEPRALKVSGRYYDEMFMVLFLR